MHDERINLRRSMEYGALAVAVGAAILGLAAGCNVMTAGGGGDKGVGGSTEDGGAPYGNLPDSGLQPIGPDDASAPDSGAPDSGAPDSGPTCPSGTMLCGAACIATDSDPFNCGACDRLCATPANGAAACSGGACSTACFGGFGDCNADPSDGCETVLDSDSANCGACGHACATSEVCSTGSCQVRRYDVAAGPDGSTAPLAYTCQEGCAIVFGGLAIDWSCSIDPAMVTHTGWMSGYGDSQHCDSGGMGTPLAEDYKPRATYDAPGAFSAYVDDWCSAGDSINYCFPAP